jgi:hypothetical protein
VIKENETRIRDLDTALMEKEAEVGGLRTGIAEKERTVINLEDTVCQRDSKISELTGALSHFKTLLSEKDQNIHNIEALSNGKDAHISNLETAIKEKDVLIGNLESVARESETESQGLRVSLAEKDATLNHIYNSHGWKTLLAYYKLRDKILPVNSTREGQKVCMRFVSIFMDTGSKIKMKTENIYELGVSCRIPPEKPPRGSKSVRSTSFFRSCTYEKAMERGGCHLN